MPLYLLFHKILLLLVFSLYEDDQFEKGKK